jgi:hypothetical protein
MSQFVLTGGAAQATPATGKITFYAKTDKKVYFKDDVGLETGLDFNTAVHSATAKVILADADEIAIADSAESYALKKTTVASVRAAMVGQTIYLATFAGAF